MVRQVLYGAVVAVTIGLYVAIVAWSAPRIAEAAGGLPIFDLRPGGYDLGTARAFLVALSAEGRDFYLRVQLQLDRFYPPFMALTLVWATLRLAPAGRYRGLAALPAILAAAFDYAENALVARMLQAGPAGLTADLVDSASIATQVKSLFTVLALIIVILAGAAHHRHRRGR